MKERVFIKIGGSYITDKTKPDSLHENRIRKIALAISQILNEADLDLILAHGAGSYGHIKAKQYQAPKGIHPEFGWQAFYQIRQDMMHMNLRFIQLCAAEKLFPITVQPSAIIVAKRGKIISINSNIIKQLLELGQIPLIHGDIVIDELQGFTIASTEDILFLLSQSLPLHRVIMISDVPGVLDAQEEIIPVINRDNYNNVMAYLGAAKGVDVTGGMKKKVEQLYSLIRHNKINKAYILSCESNLIDFKNAITGQMKHGTMIT